LAIFTAITRYDWTILEARLAVDAGLLAIVLGSLIARRPFTLQFAREEVPQEYWANPQFIATNYMISGVWAAAFVILVVADVVMAFFPTIPLWVGIVVTIVALAGAIWFTRWYPQRLRKPSHASGPAPVYAELTGVRLPAKPSQISITRFNLTAECPLITSSSSSRGR
jgi:hypothetical protein